MSQSVLVVGGGVIGTSVAWHLAERGGFEVKLLERDRLGSGTTWHSAGNITWKMTPDSDAPIDYMLESGGADRRRDRARTRDGVIPGDCSLPAVKPIWKSCVATLKTQRHAAMAETWWRRARWLVSIPSPRLTA